jgi:hypothetical protein
MNSDLCLGLEPAQNEKLSGFLAVLGLFLNLGLEAFELPRRAG